MQKGTFGVGCFWYGEEAFRKIEGVLETKVGYMGGHLKNPSSYDVLTGATGHAGVVQVWYDPFLVTFEELLEHFWKAHDPTSLNKQGIDHGPQYRSVIFFHSPGQEVKALKSKQDLIKQARYPKPIVTEIMPASKFYGAEGYHQRFLAKRAFCVSMHGSNGRSKLSKPSPNPKAKS